MHHNRLSAFRISFFFLFTAFFLFTGNHSMAQDGKALFISDCASCHNPIKQITGPALKGVTSRVPDQKLLHAWIRNNAAVLASGNKYFNDLFIQYNKTPMNTFPQLTDAEIDAIIKYVETFPEPGTGGGPNGAPAGQNQGLPESDNSLLYAILTLILGVIMLVLLQVNSNLKKLSDDKSGIPSHDPIPFYRNKVYLTFLGLVLFVVGGYYMVQGAIGLEQGLDRLLETIIVVADLEELKADPEGPARGVVIEAHLDKGRGPVATVLVQRGTLDAGDALVHAARQRRIVGAFVTASFVGLVIDAAGFDARDRGAGTETVVDGFTVEAYRHLDMAAAMQVEMALARCLTAAVEPAR
jgi:mono/diheme cytochrome c family protein